MSKPTPINKEAEWDKTKMLMLKTDLIGTIEYCNASLYKASGYTEEDLIQKPHTYLYHQDMPLVIFKLLGEHLLDFKNINTIIKNITKNGEYLWVVTDFDFVKNTKLEITNFSGVCRSIPSHILTNTIEPLYTKLKEIENEKGFEESEEYLNEYLAGKTYNEWVKSILNL